MSDLTDLKRRVMACAWAQSGWLPELKVIRWQPFDQHREEHEEAVANLAAAKTDKAIETAIRELGDLVEALVFDLRRRCGLTFSVASQPDASNEFEAVYAVERAKVAAEPRLNEAPTTHPWIDEWQQKEQPAAELVELAHRRVDLVSDWERFRGFVNVQLNGPCRLNNARVEPMPVNEASAAREELATAAAHEL